MPKSKEELVAGGYSEKQADAIVSARKKKDEFSIKKNTKKKNDALDDIYNYQNGG